MSAVCNKWQVTYSPLKKKTQVKIQKDQVSGILLFQKKGTRGIFFLFYKNRAQLSKKKIEAHTPRDNYYTLFNNIAQSMAMQ